MHVHGVSIVSTFIEYYCINKYMCVGVIDVVIIGVLQLYLGIKIERTAGFLRIALIYFIAGIGGNLVSYDIMTMDIFLF